MTVTFAEAMQRVHIYRARCAIFQKSRSAGGTLVACFGESTP